MKGTDLKAVEYVLEGRVHIETISFHDDGRIDEAIAFVKGKTGTWMVILEGDDATCNCPYGVHRANAAGHSHDQAVRLEAQRRINQGGTE